MTSLIPIGLIALVLGFLVSVMGSFSASAATTTTAPTTVEQAETVSTGAAEEMGSKFLGGYTSIIEGLMEHQANPDYERAERSRQEMVNLAEALVPQFQGLADQMQEKLDDLNIQD